MSAHPVLENWHFSRSQTPPASKQILSSVCQELRELCISGDVQEFHELLDYSISSLDFDNFNIHHLSDVMVDGIRLNNVYLVKELLLRGLPMLPYYVYEAVRAKAKDVLESFLENGWDVNQPMGSLQPPVLTNSLDDFEMETWLLDHGADPNRRCNIDFTPLSYAVEYASLPIINLLLDRGGDVTTGQLVHHAISRESDTVEVMKLLLRRGAPIDDILYQNHKPSWDMFFFMGETPLQKAAYLRKIDAIHYLIRKGADVNIKNAKN